MSISRMKNLRLRDNQIEKSFQINLHISSALATSIMLFYVLLQTYDDLSSFLSSCRAISIDIPNPFSPHLPIVHRFWKVLRDTPSILN